MKDEEFSFRRSFFSVFFLCISLVKWCLLTGKILTLFVPLFRTGREAFSNGTHGDGKHDTSRLHLPHVKMTDETRRKLRKIVRRLARRYCSMVFCLLCVLEWLFVTC